MLYIFGLLLVGVVVPTVILMRRRAAPGSTRSQLPYDKFGEAGGGSQGRPFQIDTGGI